MQPITSRISALHLLDEMYLSKMQPAKPAVVNIFNCEGIRYDERDNHKRCKYGYYRRDRDWSLISYRLAMVISYLPVEELYKPKRPLWLERSKLVDCSQRKETLISRSSESSMSTTAICDSRLPVHLQYNTIQYNTHMIWLLLIRTLTSDR